jgi:acetyl esterase/lipase
MRFAIVTILLALGPTVFAAEFRVHRDLPYVQPKEYRRILDVYTSTQSKNQPVMVWIHGGGWQRGDKSDVAAKPWAFVDEGFVFVAINYRFFPTVTMKQIAGDVSKAIRWSHDNAKKYGGDPESIFVAGHSAGASLTALVCTDDRYLKAEGLSLSVIKGCVPVDGDAFDVPLQIQTVEKGRVGSYEAKFGDLESQKDLSPVTHLAQGKYTPSFLFLHIADPEGAASGRRGGTYCCPGTDVQSQRLAKALQAVGVSAKVYSAEGKNHTTLNAELGLPGDKPTAVLFEFLS